MSGLVFPKVVSVVEKQEHTQYAAIHMWNTVELENTTINFR